MKLATRRWVAASLLTLTALTACSAPSHQATPEPSATSADQQVAGYGWEGHYLIREVIDPETLVVQRINADSSATATPETVKLFGVTPPPADSCAYDVAMALLNNMKEQYNEETWVNSTDPLKSEMYYAGTSAALIKDITSAEGQARIKDAAKAEKYDTSNLPDNLRPYDLYSYKNQELKDDEGHRYVVLARPATDAGKESIGVDYTFEQLEDAPSDAWGTDWALDRTTLNGKLLSDGLAIPDKNQGTKDTYWYQGKTDTRGVTYMFNYSATSPLRFCDYPLNYLDAAYGQETMDYFYETFENDLLNHEAYTPPMAGSGGVSDYTPKKSL